MTGNEAEHMLTDQEKLFLETIRRSAQVVELRDPNIGGHSRRVTNYALMLGRHLGLPEADLKLLELGTPLHDIGMLGVSDAVLCKRGRLTEKEFEEMKTHSAKGAAILSAIPDLHPVLPIVRSHHERWDGTGYPDKLAGEQIPLLARVVAVANAFDAMTSDAPYDPGRKRQTPEEAFAEVERMAGRQFDPQCAAAFLAIRDQVTDAIEA